MKNYLKAFLLTAAFVICLNMNSFANVGVATWGGGFSSTFTEHAKSDGKEEKRNHDLNGWQFGIKSHYYLSAPWDYYSKSLSEFGLGVFYQYSMLASDLKRTALGVDFIIGGGGCGGRGCCYVGLFGIGEYFRIYYSFNDKIELSYANEEVSGWGIGLGTGFEYAVNKSIRVFAEVMGEYSNYKKTDFKFEILAWTLNVGLKFLVL